MKKYKDILQSKELFSEVFISFYFWQHVSIYLEYLQLSMKI
jgi:hypothetical protein